MSRHRNIYNYDYEEDLYSDEDADYYGKSVEEDVPLTPGTSQYVVNRFDKPSVNHNEDIQEEGDDYDHDDFHDDEMFHFEEPKIQLKKPSPAKVKQQKTENKQTEPQPSAPTPTPAVIPAVQQLKISEKKEEDGRKSPARMAQNTSFQKLSAIEMAVSSTPTFKRRNKPTNAKDSVNLVIVGHVDAGKSTLMGHLLYQLGTVDQKTLNKYKQEAEKLGKGSFFYAWILDMNEEERTRGVTMDIARAYFETDKRKVNVLDAPGHKDFIPNMITGASQSDAALLVVNATKNEFETGFDRGGQTREHALLLRSLGVSQLIVAVNKLDTTDWSKNRFDELKAILETFLQKQTGFSRVIFVPVSGLTGDNLTKKPKDNHPLSKWYTGPTLIDALDGLKAPERSENLPLRVVVNDVLKSTNNQISLSCKIEAGHIEAGDKVFMMPTADPATVKGVIIDDSSISAPPNTANASEICFAGDQILLSLSGQFESDTVGPGNVICRGGEDCLVPAKKFDAKIVVFDIVMPLIKGTQVELFAHSMCVPCTISMLKCTLNKATGEILKEKPRHLTKNCSAIIQLKTDTPVNLEPYAKCKALGRITLRSAGQTIAAGIIDESYP